MSYIFPKLSIIPIITKILTIMSQFSTENLIKNVPFDSFQLSKPTPKEQQNSKYRVNHIIELTRTIH